MGNEQTPGQGAPELVGMETQEHTGMVDELEAMKQSAEPEVAEVETIEALQAKLEQAEAAVAEESQKGSGVRKPGSELDAAVINRNEVRRQLTVAQAEADRAQKLADSGETARVVT